MKYERTLRVSEEIKKIVSHLIRFELKDPRICELTSVTRVETTNDLRFSNIYISVHGDHLAGEDTVEGLKSAKGYVRKVIGKELNLRYTPEPLFKLDESIAESVRMSKLIEGVNKKDNHDDSETDN